MKIKKIFCSLLAFAMIQSLTIASPVMAAPADTITESTVITEENATEVAKYLNIQDKIIPNTQGGNYKIYTVGELRSTINATKDNYEKEIVLYDDTSKSPEINVMASGVKSLYFTGYGDGNYTFTVIVGGKYSETHWTGVGTIEASIDSNQIATVYKIKSNNLSATYTSTQITLGGNVNIGGYIGVGGLGLLETHSFKIEPYKVWKASSYL